MTQSILLIGPMGAGKSTIAALLAAQLALPHCALDDVRWDYYDELGYDHELSKRLADEQGPLALMAYWKPFEAHAVERVVAAYPGHIIDFGAGHSVQDDPALAARTQAALAGHHVILLLPDPDPAVSIQILTPRLEALLEAHVGRVIPEVVAANEGFIRHPANAALATHVLYTAGKRPEETCAELVAHLRKVGGA